MRFFVPRARPCLAALFFLLTIELGHLVQVQGTAKEASLHPELRLERVEDTVGESPP